MIVLDTNVLSELMRPAPSEAVVNWVSAQPVTRLFTTSITQAEILHGIMLLPAGRRRDTLAAMATAMFDEDFTDRVMPFGSDAARAYAQVASARQRIGRPISQFDAQIAAIARSIGAAVATRNVADFQECGIDVVNPWESGL